MMEKRHIFITGPPGVGKTTLICALASKLTGTKSGFITQEVREGDRRRGFIIKTLEGKMAPLAERSLRGEPRVGSYRVLVKSIDDVAVPAILAKADYIIIDEIGKMECISRSFKEAVESAMNGQGRVIATIAERGVGFIKGIKKRPDVRLFTLTRENHHPLLTALIREIEKS